MATFEAERLGRWRPTCQVFRASVVRMCRAVAGEEGSCAPERGSCGRGEAVDWKRPKAAPLSFAASGQRPGPGKQNTGIVLKSRHSCTTNRKPRRGKLNFPDDRVPECPRHQANTMAVVCFVTFC